MKELLNEYEQKIKQLIKELEDESKRHIDHVNSIHDTYRIYQAQCNELELRLKNYKQQTIDQEQEFKINKKSLM